MTPPQKKKKKNIKKNNWDNYKCGHPVIHQLIMWGPTYYLGPHLRKYIFHVPLEDM